MEDQSSVKASVAMVESHLKGRGLNVLINNAGVNSHDSLETMQPEEMLSVFNTNVVGPVLVVKVRISSVCKNSDRENTLQMCAPLIARKTCMNNPNSDS